MDKLSERLEAHAKNAASRAHWAEVGGEDSDGFWTAFAADLDAAAKLARIVEEAPVADLKWDWFGDTLAQGIIRIDKPTPERRSAVRAILNSQRVRLVRE